MRSSLLIRLTVRLGMTPGSTGSARVSTSIGSFVDSLLLVRNIVAFVVKATCITRPDPPAGQPGRGTRPCPSADIVRLPSLASFVWDFIRLDRGSSVINLWCLFQDTVHLENYLCSSFRFMYLSDKLVLFQLRHCLLPCWRIRGLLFDFTFQESSVVFLHLPFFMFYLKMCQLFFP